MGLCLAGCTSADRIDNPQRINEALLRTLTADGQRICVDSGTFGEPLAVFRTMLPAPPAVRRLLFWSPPAPLRPGRLLSGHELVRDELSDGRSILPERRQDTQKLPLPAQLQLNALARNALLVTPEAGVWLHDTPSAPLAQVRWWPLNRLDASCDGTFTFSKPLIKNDMAFVTVTAAHQGSTYALRRNNAGQWESLAKWSNWLY
jgi:hypothetical protein